MPVIDCTTGEARDYTPEELAAMVPTLEVVKARALAALASDRWEATQFFTYDGVRTQADRAVSVITGRLALREQTGIADNVTMGFKLADGEFRQWDKAGEVAFGAAIGAHIQGCFDIEAAATSDIMAAETPEEALAVPGSVTWPT